MGEQAQSQGWVYVVTNKSLPGLVKVGFTTRKDISKRLEEFNQAGLPYPYEAAYKVWVPEPQKLERSVHQFLTIHKENKEWFRCSVGLAQEAIDSLTPSHTAQWTAQGEVYSPEPNNPSDVEEGQPKEREDILGENSTPQTNSHYRGNTTISLKSLLLVGLVGLFVQFGQIGSTASRLFFWLWIGAWVVVYILATIVRRQEGREKLYKSG